MTITRRSVALALALASATPAAATGTDRWSASWTASPAPPLAFAPGLPTGATARAFRNQTIVQSVRLSSDGRALRIRLTNEYGTRALRIGGARLALLDPRGRVVAGSARRITFGGQFDTIIPAGSPWLSDAVALAVPRRARLQVSLYLPEDTGLCTCHAVGGSTAQISPIGDYLDRSFVPVDTFSARAFVSGVDVLSSNAGTVVAAFGDSITDGYLATIDGDRRWPDRLAERRPGIGIANAGLSGNRLLLDGSIALFGDSAVRRFDRDVLSLPGVSTVIVLLGINDIGQRRAAPVTAEAIIDGYRQIIARARGKGLRVLGGTMLPYEGAPYYRPEGNDVRKAVNRWILTSGAFDGTIDFDKAMRDPTRPDRLRAEFQSGDWLHPNDAGYRAMGDAVDLSLLR